MAFSIGFYGRMAACAAAVLCVSACATGQGSFVAGSGGGGSEEVFAEDAPLDEAAPGLLAASGNALLPGVRTASPAALAADARTAAGGQDLLATGPVSANVDARLNLLGPAPSAKFATGLTTNLASANLDASALLGPATPSANLNAGVATSLVSAHVGANLNAPLLALNGSPSALLGVGVTGPTALGVTPNLTVNVGGALNPATAATQTLINASVGATQPPQPAPGQSPLLPPVLGVPGTTPLQSLLPLLTPSSTPGKPPVLPGLLGQ